MLSRAINDSTMSTTELEIIDMCGGGDWKNTHQAKE